MGDFIVITIAIIVSSLITSICFYARGGYGQISLDKNDEIRLSLENDKDLIRKKYLIIKVNRNIKEIFKND